ncbi:MAG: S-adenosylmethionine decarboxylase [Acidimicrobiales bacterium]
MLQTSSIIDHARPDRIVLGPVGTAMPDLAPSIHRQQLVIEGRPPGSIDSEAIAEYLVDLGAVLDMTVLTEPVTHRSELYGWAGWVHWETSGAHFYAWDQPTRFFSVDIYTCKPFDPHEAVAFTGAFFSTDELVGREF